MRHLGLNAVLDGAHQDSGGLQELLGFAAFQIGPCGCYSPWAARAPRTCQASGLAMLRAAIATAIVSTVEGRVVGSFSRRARA